MMKSSEPKNYISDDYSVIDSKDEVVAKLISDETLLPGLVKENEPMTSSSNRSILADPRRPDVTHHINKLVKMRDFWMPFSSILAERERLYCKSKRYRS